MTSEKRNDRVRRPLPRSEAGPAEPGLQGALAGTSPLPTLAELQRGDVLRLHMGELDPNELLIAQAAVRFCYSKLLPIVDPKLWVRLARVQAEAFELFGDAEQAEAWLRTPAPFIVEQPPIAPYDLATSENGARLVMALMRKTAHGVF